MAKYVPAQRGNLPTINAGLPGARPVPTPPPKANVRKAKKPAKKPGK
jgi:hypothetical protein